MLSKVQPLSLVSSFRPHDHNRWQCSVARQPGSRRHSASAICFQALLHALQDGVCHLQELPPRVPHLLALHLLVDEPRPQIFRFGFEISPQHGPRHPAHPFSSSGALACCAPASLLVSAPTHEAQDRRNKQTNKETSLLILETKNGNSSLSSNEVRAPPRSCVRDPRCAPSAGAAPGTGCFSR